MPTVIRPHPEVVGECTYTPSSDRDFFKRILAENQSRESIQTSVSDADDGTIVACENGFVYSVLRAWQQHTHLELRPDDVWLAVLVQSSFFINGPGRAEALRHHFVAHQGQRTLVVEVGPGQTVNSFDMAAITEHFVFLLRKHLVDPNLADWLLPTFSTTLPRDRSTAAAMFLGTMKQYLNYNVSITCGFPSITLLGGASDWIKLARHVAWLADFNTDTLDRDGSSISEWSRCLVIVVEWLGASFDRPDDVDVRDFWAHACHSGGAGMSGGAVHLSGWLTTFCWWRADGSRQKAYSDDELVREYILMAGERLGEAALVRGWVSGYRSGGNTRRPHEGSDHIRTWRKNTWERKRGRREDGDDTFGRFQWHEIVGQRRYKRGAVFKLVALDERAKQRQHSARPAAASTVKRTFGQPRTGLVPKPVEKKSMNDPRELDIPRLSRCTKRTWH